MPDLPSSLALANIADGADIVAADHRNNYSAIQTAVNANIVALSGGSTGKVLTASDSDTVTYAYPPGYEWNSKQLTGSYSNSTTASDSDLVTFDEVTFDGGKVYVEMFASLLTHTASAATSFSVREGSTQASPDNQSLLPGLVVVRFDLTPTAGAHTYKISWKPRAAGTSAIAASSNGYIRARIVKA